MHGHTGVVVRAIGMIALADALNDRIDLDRIDTLGAPRQRAADVVARAGADDQDVAERLAARVAIEHVRQRIGWKWRVPRLHLLMADQVDADQRGARAGSRRGNTATTSLARRRCRLRHRERTTPARQARPATRAAPSAARTQEIGEAQRARSRTTMIGESSHERARREQDDARDAAEDVHRVGLEPVGQFRQRAAQLLSRARPSSTRSPGRSSRRATRSASTKRRRDRSPGYSTPKNTICGDAWLPTSMTLFDVRRCHSTRCALPRPMHQHPRRPRQEIHCRLAARQPTAMPRMHASSTVLVKNVRNKTCEGNQRMQVSSRKSVSRLIRNKSSFILRSGLDTLYANSTPRNATADPVWFAHRFRGRRRSRSRGVHRGGAGVRPRPERA